MWQLFDLMRSAVIVMVFAAVLSKIEEGRIGGRFVIDPWVFVYRACPLCALSFANADPDGGAALNAVP